MIRQIGRRIVVRKKAVPVMTPHKICVFKIGAMGDVLMSTPMVHALRQKFPKARIDYWTGEAAASVLAGNHDLNAAIAFPDNTFLGKRLDLALRLARQVAAQRYDLMFILDKHWSLATFGRLCNVPVRIGFDRDGEGFANTAAIPYGPRKHEIDYYLDLAYFVGARKIIRPQLELTLGKTDLAFAKQFFKQHKLNPKKTIGIAAGGAKNPGQDMVIRRWPTERFAAVAKTLAAEGWQILLIGRSPGDDHVLPGMLAAVPNAVNATSTFSLRQSAALMKQCRALICNDSGPMHFAAAVGTPTISIFGATDPVRKAPRGKEHRSVWNPIDCNRAEVFAKYDSPALIQNILKVHPAHVIKAVHQVLKQ